MKEIINLSQEPREIISKISLENTTTDDYVLIPQSSFTFEAVDDPNNPGKKVKRVVGTSVVTGQYALVAKRFDYEDMQKVTEALHKGFYSVTKLAASPSYLMVKRYSFKQVLEALMDNARISKACYHVTSSSDTACTIIFKKIGDEMKLVSAMLERAGFTVDSEDSWNFLYVSVSRINSISKVPISLHEGVEYAGEFGNVAVENMATVTSRSRSTLREIATILSERGLFVEFLEDGDLKLTLKDAPEQETLITELSEEEAM